MNKNTYTAIKLSKGEVNVYDFGELKLHAYKTNDFIDNEVFIFEKSRKAVILESPCFFDNIEEIKDYISDIEIVGMLISYHGAGASFLSDVPKYSTKNAEKYSENGGGKALISDFSRTFGGIFDSSIHKVTDIIDEGRITIGGIEFIIKKTSDAFDVEIPEINAVYTHMMGHDCHSIIAGAVHADAVILQLKEYISKGYDLILSSHYTPEDLKDAETKAEYLEDLKNISVKCKNSKEFKAAVKNRYKQYSGDNYLDMTAGLFYN